MAERVHRPDESSTASTSRTAAGPPPLRRWQVGAAEVVRIVELENDVMDPAAVLDGLTRQEVLGQPWLIPDFATPTGDLLMSFQSFAIRVGDLRIVVDTCLGADREHFMPVYSHLDSRFVEDLTRAGFAPETVDVVICTHLHFDHVGWNVRLVDDEWVPTFPNARYLFTGAEIDHWERRRADPTGYDYRHLDRSVDPIIAAGLADIVDTDHRVSENVWLEPTPGHTPGHVAVHVASQGEEAVVTGDLFHHPLQFSMPRRGVRYDRDHDAAADMRVRFIERYANSGVRIIGSHFTGPTAGRIDGERGDRTFTTGD